MALDASILFQGQAPKIDDPLTIRAKQAQLSDLMTQGQARKMQLQQAQQEQEQQQTLADLYRTHGTDSAGLVKGMASSGLGARIPGYQKEQAATAKITSENEAAKYKLMKEQVDDGNAGMAALLSDPQLSTEKVVGFLASRVKMGLMPPEQGAEIARTLPGDVPRLRQVLTEKALQGLEASKRLEMILGKTEMADQGGQRQSFTINQLTGQVTPGQAFQKTATPEAVMTDARARSEGALNRGVQIRGQDLTYKSASEGREAAKTKAGGAATEDERKSAGYAVRMEDALRTLDAVGKEDPGATKPGVGTALTNMLPEAAANYVRPENRQRVEAAQLDALDAALTLATGAAYTKEQLKGLSRSYFAQPGDTAKTIEEKTQRLKTVVETARVRSGRAEGTIDPILSRTGPNAAKTGPAQGAEEDGYVFLGGNPADPKSWKKK